MTDSMKFGPEWLRNLSSEGTTSSTSGGGSRYYLAEHRYGREEMLALFEQSLKLRPPASMLSFTTLYVDQAMNPLALAPMTEEENRMWSGRAVPPGAPRGRGGSMDRGRGRGRGGTFHPGFNRSNSSYDESVRPFDRTQSDRGGWSERNGDMGDWGVGSSPRKEYGSTRGGGGGVAGPNMDNWRRHRSDEPDSDGWRITNHGHRERSGAGPGPAAGLQEKWAGAGRSLSGNWRDGDTRDEHGHLSDRQTNNRVSWHSTGDTNNRQRRMFDDDHLPEWATENPSESGGTFDASGAFHGSDDEYPAERATKPNTTNNSNSVLQKSASQQCIPPTKKPAPLSTSHSATNLAKKTDEARHRESSQDKEKQSPTHHQPASKKSEEELSQPRAVPPQQQQQQPVKKEETVVENDISKKTSQVNNSKPDNSSVTNMRKIDDEFDHMKEVTDDIVAKLILDDEVPRPPTVAAVSEAQQQARGPVQAAPLGFMPPPPGTSQDKWYYRDPQGEVQGPFTSQEMADWFRAGYFSITLLVRRQCDERYFTLGDLVKQCPGIPFLTCRLPPLKHDPVALGKAPDLSDPLQLQQLHMQRLLQRHAEAIRTLSQTEPWGALSHLQQRELVTQHMMAQPQVLSDLPFIPQIPNANPLTPNNPLMHMISQMQQANKLPAVPVEKPPHLDPLQQLVQQMGGMQQAPAGPPVAAEPTQPEDPIKSLLRQLANQQQQQQQQQQQPQRDIWDMRLPSQPPPQWQGPGPLPHSMWDLHGQNSAPVVPPPIVTPTSLPVPMPPQHQHPPSNNHHLNNNNNNMNLAKELEKDEQKKKAELEKEQKAKERKDAAEREKKKKEQEQFEKLKAQKEAEEKRKEEQRKLEAEKKAEAEKRKKEEERIRKELEKAKREAEERKAKELEEKKKLKEQRKAEEEAKKKQEEERKKEEEEKQKKEAERAEQARRQAEALRRMQEQQQRSKVAPWCQASEPSSFSLADIQRAEREKRAEQAAQLLQQQRAMVAAAAAASALQEQQQAADKSNMQLKWATKKPAQPKKVKSLAEIQAEEQERVAKQAAEARLLQQQKEKEAATAPPANVHTSIWSSASQSLTWATNNSSGFWDDTPQQPATTTATKTNTPANNTTQQPANNKANGKVTKSRVKKEEQQVMKLFDKNDKNDEFTAWCTKTLATLNSDVDIPTFVGFLRDIESPYEVKDYVRQYLGDSPQALHFANQFVERRSRVKELQRAALQHKDDLCQPAPAINPATEFQEVKGKGKKTKKSKMMRVDARILGFSVTAAEDRINVGDRDYGDNV